jgi:hypothetical protein
MNTNTAMDAYNLISLILLAMATLIRMRDFSFNVPAPNPTSSPCNNRDMNLKGNLTNWLLGLLFNDQIFSKIIENLYDY